METRATLTRAEHRIFKLMLRGLMDKEIADQAHVAIQTVKFQLAACYRKLGISGRRDLLGYDVTIRPKRRNRWTS